MHRQAFDNMKPSLAPQVRSHMEADVTDEWDQNWLRSIPETFSPQTLDPDDIFYT